MIDEIRHRLADAGFVVVRGQRDHECRSATGWTACAAKSGAWPGAAGRGRAPKHRSDRRWNAAVPEQGLVPGPDRGTQLECQPHHRESDRDEIEGQADEDQQETDEEQRRLEARDRVHGVEDVDSRPGFRLAHSEFRIPQPAADHVEACSPRAPLRSDVTRGVTMVARPCRAERLHQALRLLVRQADRCVEYRIRPDVCRCLAV